MNQNISTDLNANKTNQSTSALLVMWQWLSYGLWWFTLVALSLVVTTVVAYYIDKYTISSYDNASALIYVVTVMLCLAIPAFFVERYYAKRERENKPGFAGVVMVLHAILLFLATLALTITPLILGIMLLRGAGTNTTEYIVNIVTCLIMLPFTVSLFVRIIKPKLVRLLLQKYFRNITFAVVLVSSVVSFIGPIHFANDIKQDVFIDENLPQLDYTISDYAYNNNKLPAALWSLKDDITDENMRSLIRDNKVQYEIVKDIDPNAAADTSATPSYAYKLCANYKHRRGTSDGVLRYQTSETIDTSNHMAGRVCYAVGN